jgi:hypothetical protein
MLTRTLASPEFLAITSAELIPLETGAGELLPQYDARGQRWQQQVNAARRCRFKCNADRVGDGPGRTLVGDLDVKRALVIRWGWCS